MQVAVATGWLGRAGAENDQPKLNLGTKVPRDRYRQVPRYYFHLHNDVDAPDPDGSELRNLEEARAVALRDARFSAGQSVKDMGHIVGGHRIDIEDENGTVLDTVYFRDAVAIDP